MTLDIVGQGRKGMSGKVAGQAAMTSGTDRGMPLAMRHRDRLTELLSAVDSPLSEYGFANLYLFRDTHDYRFVDCAIPHLRGTAYDGQRHIMPLGPIDEHMIALLDEAECLYPIGAEGPAIAERLDLSCTWNDADSDYVYDAARLALLDGAKTKRAQAREFERAQSPVARWFAKNDESEARAVLAGWLADVGRSAATTDVAACIEALSLREALGLEGMLVVRGGGEPVAFLLASVRTDGSRVVHFAKGRRAYAGAYPWMFARYAATCGAVWLNFEQDLGKPAFAQAKRALAPSGQLRKYRLKRRD